jgi:transposase
MPIPRQQTVRILGVDDWAWRKGRRYGTILCDLETGRIVDLLPDRSADSLAKWLKEHPGIEVISRDRATCYAEGSQQGAPGAVQVADRWHLLHNMTDALERVLFRHIKELKAAADSATAAPDQHDKGGGTSITQTCEIGQTVEPLTNGNEAQRQINRAERERLSRRGARAQRYDRVVELQEKGLSERAITRLTGMSRGTVRRYLSAGAFPEINSPENRRSQLDLYKPLIRERLEANASTVKELLQELRRLGYTGSESSLARYIRRRLKWNKRLAKERVGEKPKCPSPRQVSIVMVQAPDKRADQDSAFLGRLTSNCVEAAAACCIAQDFADMIRQREPKRYDAWRLQVKAAAVPELLTFARVLDRDRDAVIAGITLPWSNGPTEGHVNRLKSIKRQMYGRAGFEMLRRRVLVPP